MAPALLLLGTSVAAAGPAAAEEDRALLIRGGNIVDPATRAILREDLLLRGNVIVARGPDLDAADAEVVDAKGKWVLPGLHDLHVHGTINQAPGDLYERLGHLETARRMLFAGVTGFLDLFSDERAVFAARERIRAGEPVVADLLAAGPCLTAPGGHCTGYPTPTRLLDSPRQAREVIEDLATSRPDVVKLAYTHVDEELAERTFQPQRPTLDFDTLAAAIEAARRHGLPTVVHIRGWTDIEDATRAGASAVTHLPSHGEVPAGLAERMVAGGVAVIPTLSVSDTAWVGDGDFLEDPLLRSLTAEAMVAGYRESAARGTQGRGAAMKRGLDRALRTRLRSLAELARSGVTVLAGSDSGNWFTIHGFSLHRELELMAAAGLDPWTVLEAATVAPGEFLGRRWGVSVGDEASLLILEASPLEDVTNTRRISAVVHRGALVDRPPPEPTAVRVPRGGSR